MLTHLITSRFLFALFAVVFAAAPAAAQPAVIYVDDDAPPGGDGQTWQTAYADLQDAFDEAETIEVEAIEIRVAGGTYQPSVRTNPGEARSETFTMLDGVAILGGYRGLTPGGEPNERDIAVYVTILSGDLNGDDLPEWGNRSDNAFNVVTATDLDATAVVDGVTITAGQADGHSNRYGGGMRNINAGTTLMSCTFDGNLADLYGGGLRSYGPASPTLTNCTFIKNHARDGGGMYDTSANAVLVDCKFIENTAQLVAGGMHNRESSPTLTNCVFSGNRVDYDGGGLSNYRANPTLNNCTFDDNVAVGSGGGIFNYYQSDATLTGCIFGENTAGVDGGGVRNSSAAMTLTDCVLTGNDANTNGGGVSNIAGDATLTNCVLSANSTGARGGGLHTFNGNTVVRNCIVWNNVAPLGGASIADAAAISDVAYSCIQGGWLGVGNLSVDPLFIDPNGPDGVPGTIDDDFHIQSDSPCINAGDDSAIPPGVGGEIDGEERIQQCRVDIGVDETPYFGQDCNDNGVSDACDIEIEGMPDCNTNSIPDECETGGLVDCNANGIPDLCDIFSGFSFDCDRNGTPDECQSLPAGTLYVDSGAAGGLNNGANWQDAYLRLADALYHAACTGDVGQIRVAGGTHTPTEPSLPGVPRTETFALLNGVAVRGGYRGSAPGGDPNDRDFAAFRTILSGDLAGDDEPGWGNRAENAYNVVTAEGLDATAVLDGVTVTGGNADGHFSIGGGLRSQDASPSLSNCVFVENSAFLGGAVYLRRESPTIVQSFFTGNRSGSGGAIYNSRAHVVLAGCMFTGNSAQDRGGGMVCASGSAALHSCTLVGNTAGDNGSAMSVSGSLTLTNSIVWGDSARTLTSPIYDPAHSASISYSCIQGGWFGAGNIDTDPAFLAVAGPDDIVGTLDDDLHLSSDSPCVNAGDNAVIPGYLQQDLDGEERVQQCRVDMGVDETPFAGADCNSNGIADACDIAGGISQDLNTNGIPDECEAGGSEDCNSNGVADLLDIFGGTSADCNRNETPDECEDMPVGVVYVDERAMEGRRDGSSWSNAYAHPDDALYHTACAAEVTEVRVAAGTYIPTVQSDLGDPQSATFMLVEGVAVRGGYRGLLGGGDPDDRDFVAFETVFSGEDGESDEFDNLHRVVSAVDLDATAILDGVTLTAAYGGPDCAGSMYVEGGRPTVVNCRFVENYDSGMCNVGSSPTVTACEFINNGDFYGGSGMHNMGASPTVTDCRFSLNDSGGMVNQNASHAIVTNCVFRRNSAFDGGGMANVTNSNPRVTNCLFQDNAAYGAAGMLNYNSSSPLVINCSFVGNAAVELEGGGMYNWQDCNPLIVNCLFLENEAWLGGGGVFNRASSPLLSNCTFSSNEGGGVLSDHESSAEISNSIFWDTSGWSGSQIGEGEAGSTDVRFCCIQGGWPGVGIIDVDPKFADFTDLRLRPDSPCIDAGHDAYVYWGVDLDGHARVLCNGVDMGAYEYGIGDYECDGDVDLDDYAAWGGCMTSPDGSYPFRCVPFDFEYDGDVDLVDFARFQEVFTGTP